MMLTRLQTRAKRARLISVKKQRRIENKRELVKGKHCAYSYTLRLTMSRRGGSSNNGVSSRSNRSNSTDITPIRLFTME